MKGIRFYLYLTAFIMFGLAVLFLVAAAVIQGTQEKPTHSPSIIAGVSAVCALIGIVFALLSKRSDGNERK